MESTKILMVASEAAPFIKSGGLGDVIGSLPKAVSGKNYEVSVVLPLHEGISGEIRTKMTYITNIFVCYIKTFFTKFNLLLNLNESIGKILHIRIIL